MEEDHIVYTNIGMLWYGCLLFSTKYVITNTQNHPYNLEWTIHYWLPLVSYVGSPTESFVTDDDESEEEDAEYFIFAGRGITNAVDALLSYTCIIVQKLQDLYNTIHLMYM